MQLDLESILLDICYKKNMQFPYMPFVGSCKSDFFSVVLK
jgi:hypothetical protein